MGGLGGKTSQGRTLLDVAHAGTFLGDFDLPTVTAPTDFVDGGGSFTLRNSVTESTTGFFNTDFGVVRIDDSVSQLVLSIYHVSEDGVAITVGLTSAASEVPEASTVVAGVGLAGVLGLALRRRQNQATADR